MMLIRVAVDLESNPETLDEKQINGGSITRHPMRARTHTHLGQETHSLPKLSIKQGTLELWRSSVYSLHYCADPEKGIKQKYRSYMFTA